MADHIGGVLRQIGLALSGGGFRATLYHLGVVRFLRDAGLLEQVSHITSVSGGSVLAAHLALNWDRYCGSEDDFDAAAKEVTRFIQLDVRNRVVRRYPLAAFLNGTRRVLRVGSSRRLTRPGLLETEYEKHLYGDKSLSELPEYPQLHILATNIGEGSLCSFTRRGIIVQTQSSDNQHGFKLIQAGLATVPMAVAASSAFPGFFPPLDLSAWDVGACEGEFPPQSFTDGGVFDNLGIRMFRWIDQSWMRNDNPLRVDDFVNIDAVVNAIRNASSSDADSPVGRIAALIASNFPNHTDADAQPVDRNQQLAESLWGLIENHRLYADPSFQDVRPTDPAINSLLQHARTTGRVPDRGDHLTLNRQLLDSALQQVIGHPCFSHCDYTPGAIIVSDAGKKITSVAKNQGSGLIQTAIRSSEILMNRVWQLEKETFEDTPGCLFVSINNVVAPSEDRWALPPEIQQQATRVRTDLDYFNDLEIRSLAHHGYCVARKTCRSNPQLFGNDLPDGPTWDPITHQKSSSSPHPIALARTLQNSSKRRIWSSLLSLDDWPTYVWIPLILLFLLGGPYAYLAAYHKAQRIEAVMGATSQAKQIEVQLTSAVRTLRADAGFMAAQPPIQAIIDIRKGAQTKLTTETGADNEQVWRERLQTTFEGLLRANPAYLLGIYVELNEVGGQELVRVERYERESALVHTMPEGRLSVISADETLTQAIRLRPEEVKVFCTELKRNSREDECFPGKRLFAVAAVHDHESGDFFGMVILELDLQSAIGKLLVPAPNMDAVYLTDQEGVVLLRNDGNPVATAVKTNIVNLIPATAEFASSGNQEKEFTDHRRFVAIKISLDPNDPANAIGVVIGFSM